MQNNFFLFCSQMPLLFFVVFKEVKSHFYMRWHYMMINYKVSLGLLTVGGSKSSFLSQMFLFIIYTSYMNMGFWLKFLLVLI